MVSSGEIAAASRGRATRLASGGVRQRRDFQRDHVLLRRLRAEDVQRGAPRASRPSRSARALARPAAVARGAKQRRRRQQAARALGGPASRRSCGRRRRRCGLGAARAGAEAAFAAGGGVEAVYTEGLLGAARVSTPRGGGCTSSTRWRTTRRAARRRRRGRSSRARAARHARLRGGSGCRWGCCCRSQECVRRAHGVVEAARRHRALDAEVAAARENDTLGKLTKNRAAGAGVRRPQRREHRGRHRDHQAQEELARARAAHAGRRAARRGEAGAGAAVGLWLGETLLVEVERDDASSGALGGAAAVGRQPVRGVHRRRRGVHPGVRMADEHKGGGTRTGGGRRRRAGRAASSPRSATRSRRR